ncbi:hypothetical protein ACQP1W_44635 [Spirillospora sp. CA-255316]
MAGWYHEGGGVSPEELAKRYADIALGAVRAVDAA